MFNFYKVIPKKKGYLNPHYETHGFQVPFRAVIAAGSGVGKTNFIMNLIYYMSNTFHKIIICVKSESEPLYQMLKEKLDGRVEIYEEGQIADLIQDTEETDKKITKGGYRLSKFIIFDDLVLESRQTQERIAQFYIRGRKFGYSCAYISQSFYQVPITIRRNCNYYILGRGLLARDLKSILSSTAGSSDKRSLAEFEEVYKRFTLNPMSVCIIDIEQKLARKKIDIRELEEEDVYEFT